MSNDRYVALDVHASTTTAVVLNAEGKEVARGVYETNGETLVSFVRGITGAVHLTFEEGTHATWLYDLLKPHVAKLLVCNPRKNRRKSENKTDRIDAFELARLLRSGDLSPVYHGHDGTKVLKELVRGNEHLVEDETRIKNRLKAIFRSRGIPTNGISLYRSDQKEFWLSKLTSRGLRTRAAWLYEELNLASSLVAESKIAINHEARKTRGYKLIKSVPGFGPVRAAGMVAYVSTPFRFRTKAQLWKYCGLSVVTWSSSDWEVIGNEIVHTRKPINTRGLNRNYNRQLKSILKGAVNTTTSGNGVFKPHFHALVASGMKESLARLTLARKLAATCLAIWKKGEEFNLGNAVIRTE